MNDKLNKIMLMIFYGLGHAGTGLIATQFGFFLFKHFISAGLPVIIAGSLLILIRICDAIIGLIIGYLLDYNYNVSNWMIFSAIPFGLLSSTIWWTPTGSVFTKTIYYAIISILVMLFYKSVNLPNASLIGTLSKDTIIRTNLNASRFTGSLISRLSGLLIAGIVLGNEDSSKEYFLMGKIFGLLIITSTLISGFGLKSYTKHIKKNILLRKISFLNLTKEIFSNILFRKVTLFNILLWIALQLIQTISLVYIEDIIKVPTYIAKWILILSQLFVLIGLNFFKEYSRKYGRMSSLYLGSKLWIFGCIICLFLPPINSKKRDEIIINIKNIIIFSILLIVIMLIGFGASVAYLIPWSLLPDAIDISPSGPSVLYTSFMVLIEKIGIAISVQIIGFLLYLSGYQSCLLDKDKDSLNIIEQCYSSKITIRMCISIIPIFLILFGMFVIKDYDILLNNLKNNILGDK